MATRSYVVGPLGHYRNGRVYSAGEVVDIPEAEKPHPEWVPVDKTAPAPEPAPPPPSAPQQADNPKGKGKRPNDAG